jgi:hypothetical protein
LNKVSGTTKIYVDGIAISGELTTLTGSASYPIYISQLWNNTQTGIKNISEVKISDGVAFHTANFTPPRTQLQNDANTKLLLHFLGNGNTFVDSSPSPKTITAYGDAKQLSSPCGSGVAYFDGNGDYLTTPSHEDFQFGSNSFTIEGYFYIKSFVTTDNVIFAQCMPTYGSPYYLFIVDVIHETNKDRVSVQLYSNSVDYGIISPNGAISLNTWYHIAIVKTGTNLKLYINWVKSAERNDSIAIYPTISNVFSIGSAYYNSAGQSPFNGYISDFRVLNGIAKYSTDTITVPNQPFKPDPYTKLLLHMDGVGQAFYDASDAPGDNGFPILPDGVTVTPNGTFTSIKGKDGRNYWKFDGSTNYITLSDLESWTLGAYNFTITLWAKFDTVNAIHTLFHLFAATNSGLELYSDASAKLCLKVSDTSTAGNMVNTTGSATLIAATWYDIAIVRNGSAFTVYLNLVSDSTGSSSASIINPTAIGIGCRPGSTPDQYQLGNIKDLQLFAGRALTVDQIGTIMDETFIY